MDRISRVCSGTLVLLLGAAAPPAVLAAGQCKIAKVASIPAEIQRNRIIVPGSINGHEMDVLVDTGAALTLITQSAAASAGLQPTNVDGLKIVGVGGELQVKSTTVDELKIGDFSVRDRRWHVIGDSKTDYGNWGMIMGADLLGNFDVEFNLAQGQMTWWKPENCEKSALSYWSPDYLLAELERDGKKIATHVLLNGRKVRAEVDTGAVTSIVDLDAARRAGFREDAPNVAEMGDTGGLGNEGRLRQHIAVFDTFDMGDLTVKNARIRVANLNRNTREAEIGSRLKKEDESFPEMLIGLDFLRANRVYVANSQGYLYMTYGGGQIFQTVDTSADAPENDAPATAGPGAEGIRPE